MSDKRRDRRPEKEKEHGMTDASGFGRQLFGYRVSSVNRFIAESDAAFSGRISEAEDDAAFYRKSLKDESEKLASLRSAFEAEKAGREKAESLLKLERGKNERLTSALNGVNSENAGLKEKLESAASEAAAREKALEDRLKSVTETAEKEKADLLEKLREAEAEAENAGSELGRLAAESARKQSELRESVERLAAEMSGRNSELSDRMSIASEKAELERQLNETRAELASELSARREKELLDTIESLRAENRRLRNSLNTGGRQKQPQGLFSIFSQNKK